MKRAEMLSLLVTASEQLPENPRLNRAIKAARKNLLRNGEMVTSQDCALMLANTSRALECIADGLSWAAQLREQHCDPAKILPVLMEQNRKASQLLQL